MSETLRNSATQCHCTNPACAERDGFQSHPCGRCVKEGAVMIERRDKDGNVLAVPYCKACAMLAVGGAK